MMVVRLGFADARCSFGLATATPPGLVADGFGQGSPDGVGHFVDGAGCAGGNYLDWQHQYGLEYRIELESGERAYQQFQCIN